MSSIEFVYALSFFVGLAYALVTAIFSGVFAGGEHFDVSGDMGGSVDPSGPIDHGSLHFSPFSPIVIAMFLASFGAAGLICMEIFTILDFRMHLPISMVSGFMMAALMAILFSKILKSTQSTSAATHSDVIGCSAEVLTPIPAENGLGEIAYNVHEVRYTAPAKSIDNKKIEAHTHVIIKSMVGGTAFVTDKLN